MLRETKGGGEGRRVATGVTLKLGEGVCVLSATNGRGGDRRSAAGVTRSLSEGVCEERGVREGGCAADVTEAVAAEMGGIKAAAHSAAAV